MLSCCVCKLMLLAGHAFLLCELMLLNFQCSIKEHSHLMVTNIFLLNTNLEWTMGRQLLLQTEKASKYFCALPFSTYSLWKKTTLKFTYFFVPLFPMLWLFALRLSSFRLFCLIPMSILWWCYWNRHKRTWFSCLLAFFVAQIAPL